MHAVPGVLMEADVGTRSAGVKRLRTGGVRRRITGGIGGDLLGELLADVLDSKDIRRVPATESTPRVVLDDRVRSFSSSDTAADRVRQVLMRLRTVKKARAVGLVDGRPAIEAAQDRLSVLRGMQTSARQDPVSKRWYPIFHVSIRSEPTLRTIMRNAGIAPARAALGRGWLTFRR